VIYTICNQSINEETIFEMIKSIVLYALSHVIEGSVAYYFFDKTLGKHNRRWSIFYYCLAYFLLFGLMFLNKLIINVLAFLIINMVLSRVTHDSLWKQSAYYSFFLTAIMILTEIITAALLGALPFVKNGVIQYNSIVLVSFIVSKILFLVSSTMIGLIQERKKHNCAYKVPGYLVAIIFLICTVAGTISIVMLSIDIPDYIEYLLFSVCIMIIILVIFVFWLQEYIQRNQENLYIAQMVIQQDADSKKYYETLKSNDIDRDIMIHDIKNHVLVTKCLIDKGKNEEAAVYLEQLMRMPALSKGSCNTTSDKLNVILNKYVSVCEQKNISFSVDCSSDFIDFMKISDMTQLYCNLLDNAVEAAGKCDSPFISLVLRYSEANDITKISVANSSNAVDFDEAGMPISKKGDTNRHGFGLVSIARIVSKYNGDADYYYEAEKQIFHSVIILRGKVN